MNININNDWKNFFNAESDRINNIISQIDFNKIVYPPQDKIFNSFNLCSLKDVKVVIIGQDPYHNEGQAQGLAFSVPENFPLPPSLKNIYNELESDLNIKNISGDLSKWAEQGVFLINTSLTVEKNKPMSHAKLGWQELVMEAIKEINKKENVIFVLWGGEAKKFKKIISSKNHIIESAHPSPLSCYRGFYGSKPFSKINNILANNRLKEIDWKI
jgi:uracil-DNA glycosylase